MLSFVNPLINQSDFIFAPPPAGKPDPQAYFDGETKRERVVQKAKKESECWYTVMKWLHDPIGKNYASQFQDDRENEKIVSHRRKMLNKASRSLEYILELNSALKQAYQTEKIGLTMAKKLLQESKLKLPQADIQKCQMVLRGFVTQTLASSFDEFAMHNYFKMCNQVEEMFLFGFYKEDAELNYSEFQCEKFIQDLYKDAAQLYTRKSWKNLSLDEKAWSLKSMSFMTCIKAFDLKQSTWNPHKKITDLMGEIKQQGPLMVQGYFGKPYYQEDAVMLPEKVAERSIWGWKLNAQKKENMEYQFHPILIVGASKQEGRERVYFIDGLDQSDPQNPLARRIYAMSYRKLQEAAATLECVKIDINDMAPNATNYAVSGKSRYL